MARSFTPADAAEMFNKFGWSADFVRLSASQMESSGLTVYEASVASRVTEMLTPPQRQAWGSKLREFIAAFGNDLVIAITLAKLTWWCETTSRQAERRGESYPYHYERAAAALSFYFRVLVQAEILHSSPVSGIKVPPRPDSLRRPLTEAELRDIRDDIALQSNDPELDGFLTGAQRQTSARIGGLLNATIGSLDVENRTISILGKNGRNTIHPITADLAIGLYQHALDRGVDPHDQGAILLRYANGQPVSRRRLDTLYGGIRRRHPWAARIGLSSHFLRYTTLKDVEILFGAHVAAAYAGHRPNRQKAIDTYTAVTFEELREVHATLFSSDGSWSQTTDSSRERHHA